MKPLDPESRRLIADVLSGDHPESGVQARSWSKLAQQLHAPLPPTAAAAKTAFETAASAAKGGGVLAQLASVKLIVGVVSTGALVATGSLWYASQGPVAAPPPQPKAASVQSQPAVQTAEPAEAPAPPSAASSSLSEEAHLITQAQRALTAGNPAKALALVEQHWRSYGQGALAQERDAARIIALCALGRERDAREARRQFLRDWPGSALAARVRAACAR